VGNNIAVPRLRRVSYLDPGLTRRRYGRGFGYTDHLGHPVRDEEVLARIAALVIPPAWTDVWICLDPRGHLQAVGIDAKGRRQYLYHEAWRMRRDRQKFDRMLEFGALLPKLRHRCEQALERSGLDEDRVLAAAVTLIDLGLFRIGSPSYARDNGTYGLCTIERRHVRIGDGRACFDFPAKGGKRWSVEIDRPDVVRLVAELKAKRGTGPRLLAIRTGPGQWRPLSPGDVNDFIKAAIGAEFSAKDFRTWNATVVAAEALAAAAAEAGSGSASPAGAGRPARSDRQKARMVKSAMDEVAATLGNTPTVARRSYVDPRVIDRFDEGRTIQPALDRLARDDRRRGPTRAAVEEAVLDLLADH
jgi:DNA topoisomerase IB